MTQGISLFALAARQLIETTGPVARILPMPPFYVIKRYELTHCSKPCVIDHLKLFLSRGGYTSLRIS